MKNGFAEIVALDTARRKAEEIDTGLYDVPLSERLWTLRHITQYFSKGKSTAQQITQIESFPRAIRYTLPNGSQGQALWVPAEVKEWALVHCRC